jgi:hypothetical protein
VELMMVCLDISVIFYGNLLSFGSVPALLLARKSFWTAIFIFTSDIGKNIGMT